WRPFSGASARSPWPGRTDEVGAPPTIGRIYELGQGHHFALRRTPANVARMPTRQADWRLMHVAFLGAPAMDYEEVPPPPALAPWVAVFWRMRANRPFELRVLPDGCMDIIGTDVVGSLTKPIMVPFAAGETAAGV